MVLLSRRIGTGLYLLHFRRRIHLPLNLLIMNRLYRLGIGPGREEDEKNTEEEVNDYLARAIDARSIDRLRTEHCKRFFLSFRDKEIEVIRAFTNTKRKYFRVIIFQVLKVLQI